MREALFQEQLEDGRILCTLCPHDCKLSLGQRGACGVRVNLEDRLYTCVGDRVVSSGVDPIEKKPLFHFLPGSRTYSIATIGCNLRCHFCQNWQISQAAKGREPEPRDPFCPSLGDVPEAWVIGRQASPRQVLEEAQEHSCRILAYTYSEPTIFFELALDTARLAKAAGLHNIFVTNGFISPAALRMVAPHLDAANIDLKALDERFYRTVCGAPLAPILDAIRLYHELGVWIELTTLLIPGQNDDEEQLKRLVGFITEELSCDVPWHISRFFPAFNMTEVSPTPEDTLQRAARIGREEGLRHVYLGNVSTEDGSNTSCPGCGKRVVERARYSILRNDLADSRCPSCGETVAGVWR